MNTSPFTGNVHYPDGTVRSQDGVKIDPSQSEVQTRYYKSIGKGNTQDIKLEDMMNQAENTLSEKYKT